MLISVEVAAHGSGLRWLFRRTAVRVWERRIGKQADPTDNIFREADFNVVIGKIDEDIQLKEKDTGWSEEYREKLRDAGYDGIDIM